MLIDEEQRYRFDPLRLATILCSMGFVVIFCWLLSPMVSSFLLHARNIYCMCSSLACLSLGYCCSLGIYLAGFGGSKQYLLLNLCLQRITLACCFISIAICIVALTSMKPFSHQIKMGKIPFSMWQQLENMVFELPVWNGAVDIMRTFGTGPALTTEELSVWKFFMVTFLASLLLLALLFTQWTSCIALFLITCSVGFTFESLQCMLVDCDSVRSKVSADTMRGNMKEVKSFFVSCAWGLYLSIIGRFCFFLCGLKYDFSSLPVICIIS